MRPRFLASRLDDAFAFLADALLILLHVKYYNRLLLQASVFPNAHAV
jgi:hypothetical protein